jgi:hypothetical protein
MKTKEKEQPIQDEIPGLRDFFATSAMGGVLGDLGIPEEELMDRVAEVVAMYSYKVADAMLAEKYKNQTRH